jgi:hypothetical protein
MTEYGQQPPSLPFEEHANNINACHAASVDRVRETSLACCEANAAIKSPVARKRLFALLPFNATTFYQYAKIGADDRLMDPERKHLWPAKMRPMYELHRMTDDEFQAFEAAGLWTARLRRVDVLRWKANRSGPELSGAFYAALRPKRSLAATEMSRIDSALSNFAELFEMDVVYPESKHGNDNWAKAISHMRREAKRIVAEHIKQLKKNGRRAFQPELRKYAGFLADEVAIEHDADEDRILEVLTSIGREDEFDGIRKAAFDEYPIDGPDAPEWMETVAGKRPPQTALAADIEELRQQWEDAQPKAITKMKDRFKGIK